jgi:hypothetical protein
MAGKKSDARPAQLLKSPAKMSSRPTTLTTSAKIRAFHAQIKNFAPKAWRSYSGGSSEEWARQEARNFWHRVNNTIPFRVTYQTLLRFANIVQGEQPVPAAQVMVVDFEAEESGEEYEGESEEDEELEERPTALERDTRLVDAIIPEGQQTAAEERLARYELNRILFREYNNWYEAFEVEAAEDPHEDISAEVRFSRHCAKILGRYTGLRNDLLEAVVGGWLESHHGRV